MVVSNKGTVLVFCNRRIGSAADNAAAHLVLRRSFDGGRTWQATQVLFAREGWSGGIGNGVVDQSDGTIMIQYERWLHVRGMPEKDWVEGTKRHLTHAHRDAGGWIWRSTDHGETWTEDPFALRPNADGLKGYTHGCGPAIQLRSEAKKARLVIPAGTWTKPIYDLPKYLTGCVIYSDDHGATWSTSGVVQPGTGEPCVVETVDGAICLNLRQLHGLGQRGVAWSYDGGERFSGLGWDETLTEPEPGGCNASMIRYSDVITRDKNRILFSNPASSQRLRMTVRVSYDEGKTWPVAKLIHEGPSAHSSLAVTPDGTILCFYERGSENPYQNMTVARFNIERLES